MRSLAPLNLLGYVYNLPEWVRRIFIECLLLLFFI
jgi:hypothetical protein